MKILAFNRIYNLNIAYSRDELHGIINCLWEDIPDNMLIIKPLKKYNKKEIEKAHNLLKTKNIKILTELIEDFELIPDNMILENALRSAGYDVYASTVSSSIYVKFAKSEDELKAYMKKYGYKDIGEMRKRDLFNIIRISDHKRPSFIPNGSDVFQDHAYYGEIVTTNTIVLSTELKQYGINLKEEKYYLD